MRAVGLLRSMEYSTPLTIGSCRGTGEIETEGTKYSIDKAEKNTQRQQPLRMNAYQLSDLVQG